MWKQFVSDMLMLGLFNYRKFSLSTFQMSESITSQVMWEVRNFFELFLDGNIFLEIFASCKIIQTVLIPETSLKCFPSSGNLNFLLFHYVFLRNLLILSFNQWKDLNNFSKVGT
jgi:hypothetical protein